VPGAGSVGFGVITAFITLYYAGHGWDHAALALTALGTCFVLTRLVMADSISRFGGYPVALVSFAVEAAGLAIIWMAHAPWQALVGAAVVGFGSLVFPALGMEAVKRVPATNRGSALGAYALFLDFALGLTGPVAGLIAGHGDYPAVYLFAAPRCWRWRWPATGRALPRPAGAGGLTSAVRNRLRCCKRHHVAPCSAGIGGDHRVQARAHGVLLGCGSDAIKLTDITRSTITCSGAPVCV
jgi:MFS family permease